MNKQILLVGITTALLLGCDSSIESDKKQPLENENRPSLEVQKNYHEGGEQLQMKVSKKHIIPASDIMAINKFYENAQTSPDLLRNAEQESYKFELLEASLMEALEPVHLEQLNRADDGTWSAYFVGDKSEYLIPLTEFKGSSINGNTVRVVIDEKGDYYISNNFG